MTHPSRTPILHTPSPAAQKLELLRQLFPQAVEVEADGRVRVNASAMQQVLDPANPAGVRVEEDGFELRWVGKREAFHSAFVPAQKILQPAPEQSKNWQTTGNLLIKGDNIDALRLLRHSYFGKVKLIYIDPPYNTQSEAFIYRDDFSAKQSEVLNALGYSADNIDYIKNIYGARTHSGWLSFMYPRLLLAKDLLRDDGVIFISIDDNEQAQLKLLCDEIFGQENFVANVIWQKKYTRANDAIWLSENHDHLLLYSKNKSEAAPNLLPRTEAQKATYSNPDSHHKGPWKATPLHAKSGINKNAFTFANGVTWAPPPGTYRRYSDETMRLLDGNQEIWFGENLASTPSRKSFLSEVKQGITPVTIWLHEEVGHTHEANEDLKKLVGQGVFNNPKPVRLIRRALEICTATDSNDIVLDFFAGSGTTAEAVMRLNAEDGGQRQFILVQIPQPIDAKKQKEAHTFVTQTLGKPEATIFEITAERIRRAGAKIEAELAAKQNPQAALTGTDDETTPPAPLDTGFRVFELVDDPDALILQKPLGEATQADVLAFQTAIATPQPHQLERILYNLLLAEGLPLSTPMETLQAGHLYCAADVLLVLQAVPLEALTDLLRKLRTQVPPVQYLTVYAPWVQDDNFTLGVKTMVESLGMGEDKLRLRG